MTILENDKFLSELGKYFMKARLKGSSQSISLTMKPYDGRTKPSPKTGSDADNSLILFRAKVGNSKISTVVQSKQVNSFHAQYSACLLRNIDGLQRTKKGDDKQKGARVTKA